MHSLFVCFNAHTWICVILSHFVSSALSLIALLQWLISGNLYIWVFVSRMSNKIFSPSYSTRRERGHIQRFRVLLLWLVSESHPEQQRRDHIVLQDLAKKWPYPSHGQVSRLRQPGPERWGCFVGHQLGFRSLRGHCRACQWQIQRQRLAWCESHTQPQTGNAKVAGISCFLI